MEVPKGPFALDMAISCGLLLLDHHGTELTSRECQQIEATLRGCRLVLNQIRLF